MSSTSEITEAKSIGENKHAEIVSERSWYSASWMLSHLCFQNADHLVCSFKEILFQGFSSCGYGAGQVEKRQGFWEDVVKVVLGSEIEIKVFDIAEGIAEPLV